MKLENLYYAMQERYSAEQEKKEAAEQLFILLEKQSIIISKHYIKPMRKLETNKRKVLMK